MTYYPNYPYGWGDPTPVSPAPSAPITREGWECPKCGAVMAPWRASCVNDHHKEVDSE